MSRGMMVAPSMGCCDLFGLDKQVRFIDERADFLHMDIKDGNYVKTFGIGTDFISYLKPVVKIPIDAHLMVKHPQDFIEACAQAGATHITQHTDCMESDAFASIKKIRSLGCKAGVALNPAAWLEAIRYYIPLMDKVTIMVVDAGYSGQNVIVQMCDKIRTLARWRKEMNLQFLIEADGSMNGDMYLPLREAGTDVVVLGLGTWAMGGGPAWERDMDVQECVDTIHKALKCGINVIDTAPGYNFGNSELIVGKALKGLNRADVTLITKCGIVWKRQGSLFNKVGDTQLYKNLSPESLREEIGESMERLGTDYFDVYMTHWQSVEPHFTPIAETMEMLNEFKAQGKIKSIGASNITEEQIREHVKCGDLDIVQAKYSIMDRAVEEEFMPVCKEFGITLQAYSPLEHPQLNTAHETLQLSR